MPISLEPNADQYLLKKETPVHFVGIGGVGMSGLAKILAESGFKVSGSDAKENKYTQELAAKGVKIFIGHHEDHVPQDSILVVSTAIDLSNPEIARARDWSLPISHRSGLLREILHGDALGHKTTIGITGTHGKTTVTGMAGLVLQACGVEPTIVAGGKLPGLDTNAVFGKSRNYAVAELDESDGTVLAYHPTITLINNLELDHADHYTGGIDELLATMHRFLDNLPTESIVLYNASCTLSKKLISQSRASIEFVAVAPNGESAPHTTYWLDEVYPVDNGAYKGLVSKGKKCLGEISLSVPGIHNLHNALAVIAIADLLNLDFATAAKSLKGFGGMGRRFERVGEYNGATLIDDYAHHPTEVAATLEAAEAVAVGDVIAVFQPHRYTRLQALWDDFLNCFDKADLVIIADVYSAGEKPIDGVSSETFAKALAKKRPADSTKFFAGNNWKDLLKELAEEIESDDLVLSMGAGDVTNLLRGWK